MEDGRPSVGVDFIIDGSESFESITTLENGLDRATANMVAEIAKVEKAAGGMLQLGGATARVTTLGNAATREMAAIARETRNAERSGESMARQMQRQIEVFGKTATEVRNLRAEQRALAAEARGLTELANRLRAANAELNRMEASSGRAAPSLGATRSAMQGVSFQAQDMFTQLSMNANIFSVLAIQGGQMAGQMAHMEGAAGKFANFMIGPWGLAITAGMLVLGTLTKGLLDGADAAKKKEEAARDLANAIDALAKSTRSAVDTEWDLQRATLSSADAMRKSALDARAKTIETIGLARAQLALALAESARADPSRGQDGGIDFALARAAQLDTKLKALDAQLATQQAQLQKTTVAFREAQAAYAGSAIAATLDKETGLTRRYQQQLSALTAEMRKTGDINAYMAARRQLEVTYTAEKKALHDAEKAHRGKTAAEKEAAKELAEQKRALEAATKAAQSYISAQEMAGAKVTKTAKEIRLMEDAAARLAAPTEELRKKIDEVAAARETSISSSAAKEFEANVLRPLRDEIALHGLVGAERATAALEMERDAFFAKHLGEDLAVVAQRWNEYYAAKKQIIYLDDAAKRDADNFKAQNEAATKFLHTLQEMVSVLGEINPLLGSMAGIAQGLKTRNFSNVRGPAGAMLQLVQQSVGDEGWKALIQKLDSIFGPNGDFVGSVAKILKAAGTGMAASQLVNGGKGNNLGAAIGGSIGEKVGEKFLSKGLESIAKGLGSFAGPIGSIIGGVLGGVIGGLFKKAPSASTVVTSALGNAAINGNDNAAKQAVGQVTTSLQSTIKQISDALGGTLGQFAVSIGQREDYYRVAAGSTTAVGAKHPELGTGVTLLYNGQDATEAMRVALLTALQQGAVQGIRQGAQNLIRAGSDLQTQLNKALSFQGVFDQLAQRLDPAAYALEQFEKKAKDLRAIFAEATATTEDYAKLEQLLTLQRQDVIDEAAKRDLEKVNNRRALEIRLLEAQGKSTEALALTREIEMSQTDETLRALLQQVYAAEDLAGALNGATGSTNDLAEAWKDASESISDEIKRIRGLTAGTNSSDFATLMGQFNAANAAARGGDIDAAKDLPQLSQDLLNIAAQVATSRQELARVQAQTAAMLEATNAAIAARAIGAASSDAELIAASSSAQSSNTPANDPGTDDLRAAILDLKAEVTQLRTENNSGHAAVASAANRGATVLENVTADSGGDAIAMVARA